jgi:choline dehydrogenase-like flavoprotein
VPALLPAPALEILDAFAQAAQQAGIPASTDFNRDNNEFEVNQRRGVRWTTAKAFLRPARMRANLSIQTSATVTRMLLERDDGMRRTVGIEVRLGGGTPVQVFDAFTASVCNLIPSSHGHVRIASPDPARPPSIRATYLSPEHDRRVTAESLRLTRRIVAMPTLAPYQPQEFRPGVQFQNDEEPARLAGDIGTTIFHPLGPCRMGHTNDDHAVVNTRLWLCGLHVADASVMPTITCGSTNSPVFMIAECAAH